MVAEINAYVEVVVIPVRFMILTPLASCVHLGDVVIDLPAVLAVAANVTVDSGSIRFQPAMALVIPVPVCASGTAESQ
jgi:hypothetical protein